MSWTTKAWKKATVQIYSEKITIWKISPIIVEIKKMVGFFKIVWPSNNIWTLKAADSGSRSKYLNNVTLDDLATFLQLSTLNHQYGATGSVIANSTFKHFATPGLWFPLGDNLIVFLALKNSPAFPNTAKFRRSRWLGGLFLVAFLDYLLLFISGRER